MPRGPKWSDDENQFLAGILQTYGDKPRDWSDTVREMVKARLASRTESGIYQQALKILKARSATPQNNGDTPLSLATGA